MKRVLALGLLLAMLGASSAQAGTTAEAPYAQWLSAAKMPPLPELEVTSIGRCQELGAEPDLGCTNMETFIALAPEEGPKVFLHEEGHVFVHDYVYGNPTIEARIVTLIGHPKLQWYAFYTDGSLDEAFADAFARCGIAKEGYPILPRWKGYSIGSVEITGSRLLALCQYIRSL